MLPFVTTDFDLLHACLRVINENKAELPQYTHTH